MPTTLEDLDHHRIVHYVQTLGTKSPGWEYTVDGRSAFRPMQGAVTVIATGTQKLVSVRIDPEAAGDPEMLQDLVVAAVNEALERSKQMAAEKMQSLSAGMGLPPGLLG